MKNFISLLGICFAIFVQLTHADGLEDLKSCVSIKESKNRLICYDTAASKINEEELQKQASEDKDRKEKLEAAAKTELPYNVRGLECQNFEFTELNTYSADELEQLYCSYAKGAKVFISIGKKSEDSQTDPSVKLALMRDHFRQIERCRQPMQQVSDLHNRKFPDTKINCLRYKGFNSDTSPQ